MRGGRYLLLFRERLFAATCVLVFIGSVLFVRLALGMEFPIPWNDETAFISQAFEFSRTGSFYVYGLNSDRVVMWMPPGFMLLLASIYKVFGYSFEISRWVSCVLYLGCGGIAFLILRKSLQGGALYLGAILMLIAFLSPYSLAISNIARMESLYSLLFLFSLLAALSGRYAMGLALVLFSAVVHFNAVYFLLPYAVLVCWKILRREELVIGPWELLALVFSLSAVAGYGLYVVKNIHGFWQDMQFQFAYKLGSEVMGGMSGRVFLLLLLAIPFFQLILHRRFANEAILTLYGIAFIAMALNGHSMWYYFAYNFGLWLLLIGVLATIATMDWPFKLGGYVVLCLLSLSLLYFSSRNTFEFDPLKPTLATLKRDFLPDSEIEKVKNFIASLPPGTSVSFGYSGVEPYFFEDFSSTNTRWTGSAHSVIQVLPARDIDYRVLCDSEMFPSYLSVYDWDGFPRMSQDSGCTITQLKAGGDRAR